MQSVLSTTEVVVLHHPLATISTHAHGFARIDWHVTPMVSADVRSLFGELIVVLRHTCLTKVLTDRSCMPPLWPADCEWLVDRWVPLAAQRAGCTHIAVVEDAEILRHPPRYASTERLQALPVTVRYFDHFTCAQHWLCAA